MKNFEVLDLKEESDVPEPVVGAMSKLENLNDAIDQCTFMETEQLPEPSSEETEPKAMPDSVDAVSDVQELPQCHAEVEPRADSYVPDVNAIPEAPEAEVLVSTSNSILNPPELDEAIASVDPHEHKTLYERSLSTCSDIAEDNGVFCEPSSDHHKDELEMDNEDLTTVIFYPDHLMYRDSCCTNCVLTFTSTCIKLEGSTLEEDDKTFKFQWGVHDVLHIKSHWYDLVKVAMVTIHLQPENIELKFTIVGENWFGKHEAVTSLNVTYKSLWTSMLESEDIGHGAFTKYFPNFDEPFEEVIYPKGDVDAVSISKRDVDLLLPDTFVNDTIIDFYIKYLKNKIKPEERNRFHFFNSFFFRKLADPDKDPFDASKGKAAFQRVKKWTRKVNLFDKDFVFIPVNYNYHWSLIVMCHLGEVATYKDGDVRELIKVPCILHMDSIRGSHTGLKGLMQSYLKEEWKEKHKEEASEDIFSRFDNLRFISLELPQQPNSFDCGLFLLHYVELFLEQAPVNFNPFKITKSVNFLNTDWFVPADASLKRVVIQRLVYDLLEQPCDEPPSMAVNFFPEMCSEPEPCPSTQGIEISLLTNEPCPSESLKPEFEAGAFLGMQFPSFNETTLEEYKPSLTPIEEDVETGVEFVFASTENGNGIGIGIGMMPEDFEDEKINNNLERSPETSVSGCEDSLEVVNGINGVDEEVELKEMRDEARSVLREGVEMVDGDDDNDLGTEVNGGRSGSGESSGMESEVQHPAKRMRMIEAVVEGDGCN